jgi:hypothetical protein
MKKDSCRQQKLLHFLRPGKQFVAEVADNAQAKHNQGLDAVTATSRVSF